MAVSESTSSPPALHPLHFLATCSLARWREKWLANSILARRSANLSPEVRRTIRAREEEVGRFLSLLSLSPFAYASLLKSARAREREMNRQSARTPTHTHLYSLGLTLMNLSWENVAVVVVQRVRRARVYLRKLGSLRVVFFRLVPLDGIPLEFTIRLRIGGESEETVSLRAAAVVFTFEELVLRVEKRFGFRGVARGMESATDCTYYIYPSCLLYCL